MLHDIRKRLGPAATDNLVTVAHGMVKVASRAVPPNAYQGWVVKLLTKPDEILQEHIEEALKQLVSAFDDEARAYDSEPDPENRPRFSDYRHLARVREWRPEEGPGD